MTDTKELVERLRATVIDRSLTPYELGEQIRERLNEAADALEAAEARAERAEKALLKIIAATHSHLDGRDLLAELHPRKTLDIKRRIDGRETWFEGDWLTYLWWAIKDARDLTSPAPDGRGK